MNIEIIPTDGRIAFYQWDTNRYLRVSPNCSQVHMWREFDDNVYTVTVSNSLARVPDEILQNSGRFNVSPYDASDKTGRYTLYRTCFRVIGRPKPSDYIYTPTEVKTWADLQKQIGDLDLLTTPRKENLVDAINSAAESVNNTLTRMQYAITENEDGIDWILDRLTLSEVDALDVLYETGMITPMYQNYCFYTDGTDIYIT